MTDEQQYYISSITGTTSTGTYFVQTYPNNITGTTSIPSGWGNVGHFSLNPPNRVEIECKNGKIEIDLDDCNNFYKMMREIHDLPEAKKVFEKYKALIAIKEMVEVKSVIE